MVMRTWKKKRILRVSFFLEGSGLISTGFRWAVDSISLAVPATGIVVVTRVVVRALGWWQLTWIVLLPAGCELECTDWLDTEPWPPSRSHPSGSRSDFICLGRKISPWVFRIGVLLSRKPEARTKAVAYGWTFKLLTGMRLQVTRSSRLWHYCSKSKTYSHENAQQCCLMIEQIVLYLLSIELLFYPFDHQAESRNHILFLH